MEPNHKLLLGTNYVCSLSQRRNLSIETASTTIGITEDVNQLGSRSKANANEQLSTVYGILYQIQYIEKQYVDPPDGVREPKKRMKINISIFEGLSSNVNVRGEPS